MNSSKTIHLKLIPNSSYHKRKLYFPITNKDYYLFNLINRKRKAKIENSMISKNDDIIKKSKLKIKKFINYLNTNDKCKNLSQTLKKSEESIKNNDTDLNILYKKKAEILEKFNTTNYIKTRIKVDNSYLSKKIKNSLIITPLNLNNNIFIAKKNNRSTKLKKFTKSFTTSNYKENEKGGILNHNFLSITPIKKYQLFQSRKINKISKATQINTDFFHEIKFVNNKINSAINIYKSSAQKRIIFQKKLKKMKSVEYYYKYE